MNYKLQITKTETNENFSEEMKQWQKERKDNFNYNRDMRPEPITDVVKNVLLVELTEDQFKKVKQAVLKEFE